MQRVVVVIIAVLFCGCASSTNAKRETLDLPFPQVDYSMHVGEPKRMEMICLAIEVKEVSTQYKY